MQERCPAQAAAGVACQGTTRAMRVRQYGQIGGFSLVRTSGVHPSHVTWCPHGRNCVVMTASMHTLHSVSSCSCVDAASAAPRARIRARASACKGPCAPWGTKWKGMQNQKPRSLICIAVYMTHMRIYIMYALENTHMFNGVGAHFRLLLDSKHKRVTVHVACHCWGLGCRHERS